MSNPQNGSARSDRSERSSGRAINSEANNSHGCSAFFGGKGSRNPLGGPEKSLTGVNIYHLWKGEGPGAHLRHLGRTTWYGNTVFVLIGNQFSVKQMNTPLRQL